MALVCEAQHAFCESLSFGETLHVIFQKPTLFSISCLFCYKYVNAGKCVKVCNTSINEK